MRVVGEGGEGTFYSRKAARRGDARKRQRNGNDFTALR